MPSLHHPHLSRNQSHGIWNRDLPPKVVVKPDTVVTFDVNNASGGQIHRTSTASDVANLDFSRVNPVTGPVAVEGAEPGDGLLVEILAIDLDDFGWTANIPGFGLLADEFPNPHLRISRITEGFAELLPGLGIPLAPFIGTIGVAPADPGNHSVVPPRRVGGNMDMRHLTVGARLALPVEVPGALLSVGDTHAAQGDGEVCGTAIEVSSTVTLRVSVLKGQGPRFPVVFTDPASARTLSAVATTGIGPDLYTAARDATRGMVDYLVETLGISAVDAYLLCSAAADLKISEIVDAPHWVVSMHIEQQLLRGDRKPSG